MGILSALANWLSTAIYGPPTPPPQNPPPPARSWYGFRWQAGQGVPAQLARMDPTAVGFVPGIYVVFRADMLDEGMDPFGRDGAGTVYTSPPAVSPALQQLVAGVAANPPAQEAYTWQNVSTERLRDLDGFLGYTAACLNLLHQAPVGQQLLQQLSAGPRNVIVTPALRDNSTATSGGFLTTVARAVADFAGGEAIDGVALDGMVNARYANLAGAPARYAQLAADLNAMPLYSLFAAVPNLVPTFLATNFTYNGAPLDGPTLQNWLTAGDVNFDNFLRTSPTMVQGVRVVRFFLLALVFALYANSPAGTGGGAGVSFSVRLEDANDPNDPDFRPPAVGLAHELMHALHYTRGTAPGLEFNHFTTTAAELLFIGIVPFAAQPITENAVRAAWHTLNPDPSNQWPNQAPRTIYFAPTGVQTPQSVRNGFHNTMI